MLASKFFDPVVGLDIHFELTPWGVPAPFPNPFVGLIFDPMGLLVGQAMGYAMALATGSAPKGPVFINSMPAANVGTEAKNYLGVPHILMPPGVAWAPMPKPPRPSFRGPPDPPGLPIAPEGDAVHVFGSQSVSIMGSSAVRMGDYALSCGEPVRLPSSVAMAIPMGAPVLIGGPPALSLSDAAGALVRTRWVAGHLHALVSRLKSDRLRNLLSKAVCFLTGHPVDVATGRVLTDALDFELPGALLRLERHYSSAWANRSGPLGPGWSHSLDQAVWPERGKVVYLDAEGREIEFDSFAFPDHRLPDGGELYEPISRLTLRSLGNGRYTVTTHDGIEREFARIAQPLTDRRGGVFAPRSSWSRLLRERTRAGARLTYRYDERGSLAAVTDSGGRSVRFEHDSQGRLSVVRLPDPVRPEHWVVHCRYGYDDAGELVVATDALGNSFRYEYKTQLLTRETNRNGLSFYFAYDGYGQDAYCVRTWGDGGLYDHLISYDKAGHATFVQNSLGFTTSYFMNAVGAVTKVIDPVGGTTQYEYDEASLQRTKVIDPMGASTAWEYDSRGNRTQILSAGAEIRIRYGDQNLPEHVTDALGGEWRWSYDDDGRLLARQDALGQRTHFEWRGPLLVGVTDAMGQLTQLEHDAAGNLIALIPPDGSATRWVYDERGRCVLLIDPNGNQQRRRHDALGRVVRVEEPDGNVRELDYDPEGNVTHARDRDHDVRLQYQGMSRLAARSEAGTRIAFGYDTEEQLLTIQNEHGAVYRFVLDPAGNVAEEHGFDGLRRRYQRDKGGRLTQVLRAASASSKYAYDAASRVTAVAHSDGTSEAFEYRADGELIRATNDATELRFERDAQGRILKELQGQHWVSSEYDPLGRRKAVRSSKGLEQRIRRNGMGDVLSIEAGVHTLPPLGADDTTALDRILPDRRDPYRIDFERDRLGLELQRHLPGGVRARWQRDRLGRPELQEIQVRSIVQSARSYQWQSNDRLRAIIDATRGPVQFTHDSLGNLAAATYADGRVELRLPDAVGNLFKTRDRSDRKYGPAGQLIEATDARGTTHWAYDPEGNLIQKLEPDGKRWSYRWNLTGMLVEVQRPDGDVVAFTYDPLGRRISKTFRGKTTHWIWDANVPLHEWITLSDEALLRDGAPLRSTTEREIALGKRRALLVQRSAQGPPSSEADAPPLEVPLLEGTPESPITWLFEPESFAPLAKLVSEERYSIITDHLGTPRAMYDGRGSETWAVEIDTYGGLRDLRGQRRACPFRFPGQYEDEETGLYYNRFRYYDSESGGYVSQDPIGLAGGVALYAYPLEPNRRTDPLGLSATCGGKPGEIVRYYPPNDGFAKQTSVMRLPTGTRIDRFGGPHGRFVSPEGVPMPMRALPHDADLSQHRIYEVLEPLNVQGGHTAPAFGKIGGGIQYVLPKPVSQLVKDKVLGVVLEP
ncbi:MAG: glycohydrolase toxin TNT-related protein [Deltaproteobacteria bacterium]